jgi:hypothetical protein
LIILPKEARNKFLKNGNKLWRWQHQTTSSKQPNKERKKNNNNNKNNNQKDQIKRMLMMSATMFEGENK